MIQSHYEPYKSLEQHIQEVAIIANAIIANHFTNIKNIKSILKYIIDFHDLGKAIPAFQKYISNPKHYKGKRKDKAHTPVSLLLWIAYAQENNINLETFLLVAVIVWKHHGDFPTFEEFYYHVDDFEDFSYPFDEVNLKLRKKIVADDIDIQDTFESNFLDNFTLESAALLRLKAQFLFSIFIESDRTFLALPPEIIDTKFNKKENIKISPTIVSDFLLSKSTRKNQNKTLNILRTKLRKSIIDNTNNNSNIESVTLPTGLGKTMVAAQWALKHREKKHRKVIIVLPFLSIIDQTVKEYKKLFKDFQENDLILEAHSLAERKYVDDANEDNINNSIDFLADTWENDFIITTFDQFIYSLLSAKNANILRFHNLVNALIIVDEIQALATHLWDPLSLAFNTLTKSFNSKILIMSATQPYFLKTRELVTNKRSVFNQQNRYKLLINYKEPIKLDDFIDECSDRINQENWYDKRVLIVLNTRASARSTLDALEDFVDGKLETYFLSADVTPKERIANIEKIKKNKPCLVISTQCIEAGVDIDMDFVIRDIAPLDSIVQCAGRCNRNAVKKQGKIEIISLHNNNGKLLSSFVYDKTLLEKTKLLFAKYKEIQEKDIYSFVSKYFILLNKCKDTGKNNSKKWAYWKEELNIKKLLRGDSKKYDFIVSSQDTLLKNDIENALAIENQWQRKRQMRMLKGRIAKVTVSIWATQNIIPEEIAEPIGCFYILKNEFYTQGKGLTLKKELAGIIL